MNQHSPQQPPIRPHPLAPALAERIRAGGGVTVLEIGRGSGRNTHALKAAGLRVVDLDDANGAGGALATHALLHGTGAEIEVLLQRIAGALAAGAPLFATFGSQRDGRFGHGTPLGPGTYAAVGGDEAGVAHTYFDEPSLRALLERNWHVESIEEHAVDAVAGTWAHRERPLRGAVHWFVRATRR